MAVAALEILERGQGMARPDFLSLVPQIEPQEIEDYDIASCLPQEILLGDPLPETIFNAYLGVIDPLDYGFKRWKGYRYIQINSSVLYHVPKNGLDETSVYAIESVMESGDRTLYEAEAVLVYPEGWGSNKRDYIPTGVVRITGFSSDIDESVEGAEAMDAASVQFSYEENKFAHGYMLRSNEGSNIASGGEVLAMGEVVSFNVATEPKPKRNKAKQLPFEGYEIAGEEVEEESNALVLPSVRLEGDEVVMTHFGKPYQLGGATVLQAIEIRAPFDITGLAELVREQGKGEDETDTEDEAREDQEPLWQFATMTQVYKAATQFPVSIKTIVIPVR